MSVISKFNGFLTRHRNKFVVGGAVIAGSVLITKYARQKFIHWQETETKEFLERNRKQTHFESIVRTCNQTISTLSSTLTNIVINIINTDHIIQKLKNQPSDKVRLWNELKVSSQLPTHLKFEYISITLSGSSVLKSNINDLFLGNANYYTKSSIEYNRRLSV